MGKYSRGDIVEDRRLRQGVIVAVHKTYFGYMYDVLISGEIISYVEEDIFLIADE